MLRVITKMVDGELYFNSGWGSDSKDHQIKNVKII